MPVSSSTAACECGRVALSLAGDPIASVVCHCDDCQEGSRRIEALDGARVRDAWGGTPYLLYRADRVAIVRGADLLRDHELTETTATRRTVAACCRVPMLLRFDRGPHWVSIFRARVASSRAPEMRIQTKHAPAATVPRDVPSHRGFPLALVARLVVAKLAMLARRSGE